MKETNLVSIPFEARNCLVWEILLGVFDLCWKYSNLCCMGGKCVDDRGRVPERYLSVSSSVSGMMVLVEGVGLKLDLSPLLGLVPVNFPLPMGLRGTGWGARKILKK